MRSHPLLLAILLALFTGTLPAQTQTNRFDAEIARFEAQDRTNPPPKDAILFVGSSSIRLWKTLAEDFPDYKVINRGFGGSQISDCVHFAGRIVVPYRPRIIVFYCGGNDLNAGKTPEEVASDFKSFVAQVRAKLPNSPIVFLSIAPNPARWAQVDRVKRANQLVHRFTLESQKLIYVDVFSHMLAGGEPRPDIYVDDRLHLNGRGYALWASLLRPILAKLSNPDDSAPGVTPPSQTRSPK